MRLSESQGPWTFTLIKFGPGWSTDECGVSRGHRAQSVQPMRPAPRFGVALRGHDFDGRCARCVSGVSPGRGRGFAVINQSDRGQFACEEHDHGLLNVRKGLARPMMAWSGMGPK